MHIDYGKFLCLNCGIKESMDSFVITINIYSKSNKYHLKYTS